MIASTAGRRSVLHNARRARVLIAGTALVLAAVGCGFPELPLSLDPPIESEHVALIEADRGSLHSQAGLYFVLRNRGSAPIRSITIAFDLYDSDGSPAPGFGANGFSTAFPVVLDAFERGSWCIALDPVGADGPGLRVARLRVLEVGFADGSTWWTPGGHLIGDPASEPNGREGYLR